MALTDDSDLYHFYKADPSVLASSTHPPRGPDLGDSPADILQPLPQREQRRHPLLTAPFRPTRAFTCISRIPVCSRR